jgi:hypothetical protein
VKLLEPVESILSPEMSVWHERSSNRILDLE